MINTHCNSDAKLYNHKWKARRMFGLAAVYSQLYTASDGGVRLLPSSPIPYPSPRSTPDASSCELDRPKPCSRMYGCCCIAEATLSAGGAVPMSIGCRESVFDSSITATANVFCSSVDAASAAGSTGHSKCTQWNTCNKSAYKRLFRAIEVIIEVTMNINNQ